MFGADAGWLMQLAEEKKKEDAKLAETDEGQAVLDRRAANDRAYDNIPDGAKCYQLIKLSRRSDARTVRDGEGGAGYVRVLTNEKIKHLKDEDGTEFLGLDWECQKVARPKIGSVFMVAGAGRWLRTSLVESYYVHDDPDNYKTHPDKLVLPPGFPIETATSFPELKPGDVVLCTMNSLYLCREMPGHEYKKAEGDA